MFEATDSKNWATIWPRLFTRSVFSGEKPAACGSEMDGIKTGFGVEFFEQFTVGTFCHIVSGGAGR